MKFLSRFGVLEEDFLFKIKYAIDVTYEYDGVVGKNRIIAFAVVYMKFKLFSRFTKIFGIHCCENYRDRRQCTRLFL